MFRNRLSEKVLRFARPLFSPGASVVAAVSGGSDSIALLFLLSELRQQLTIAEIVVAHLNHGLRGEASDGDELLVREYAGQLGLRFYTRRLTGHRIDEPGLEAAVREERYCFFDEVRAASGCRLIATGHTMDDQAETVLMRIIRGSGLNGLRGIAPLREDGIVRPLLSIRKKELLDWLSEEKIAFRSDASNNDTRFFRNRVRNDILPLIEAVRPGAVERLADLSMQARKQWRTLQQQVKQWRQRYLFACSADSFRLDKRGLAEVGPAAEALRQAFIDSGVTPYCRHIEAVFDNAVSTGRTFLLPGGWRYLIGREVLFFERLQHRFSYTLPVPGECRCTEERRALSITVATSLPPVLDYGKWMVVIDGADLGDRCVYRSIGPDDRFIPFGTTREVPMLPFLSKQGIAKPERERTGCLVTADNKPIWIPGIRIDERFRVTAGTKKLIKLQSESIL
ncbi:MAG: tRNA lysidine(34) synthetase TilS [Chitinispirillaceae bacterium]|nr:tRNA lysidine(34) synthetase TilS [Chitinispirillaceae bacterium]